nr:methyl-accepting chemotaxis protein [Variovorax boronicumulans]
MNLQRLTLGTRLGAAFTLLVLITLTMGALAFVGVNDIHDDLEALATNWLPSVDAVNELRADVNQMRRSETDLVFSAAPAQAANAADKLDTLRRSHEQHDEGYRRIISSADERDTYDAFVRARSTYLDTQQRLRALAGARGGSAGDSQAYFLGDSKAAFEAMMVPLRKLVEINNGGAHQAHVQAGNTYRQVRQVLLGALVLAVLVAVVLGIVVTRSVTRPLAGAIAAAERVAAGDLSQSFDAEGRDEVAQLLRALLAMQQSLSDTVQAVRSNAEAVATASAQIAQGNGDLSQRTEEQASALQQTAATMDELAGTVRANADSAQQANQLAQHASQVAGHGGAAVREVVEKMQRIQEGSGRIAEIIGVIDGIAFQTNILALNAAVEAARAGEQGRGFAVVASEVRALAQRSAGAAKEIKELITGSAAEVQQGSDLVRRAGQTMEDVVAAIERVHAIAGEISSASKEQSHGVSQVGQAVSQMDQVTQQNAALVEESAAAADSLRGQASRLVEAVTAFRLSGPAAQAVPAPPARVAEPASPRAAAAKRPADRSRRPAAGGALQLAHSTTDWAAF